MDKNEVTGIFDMTKVDWYSWAEKVATDLLQKPKSVRDADLEDYERSDKDFYDKILVNNGTIEDLTLLAKEFLWELNMCT